MNKDLFLMQLEQMLYDIPREEREEAMDYYRSYFEDAGVENEAVVLEELESPQEIAKSIKEALDSTGNMAGGLKNPPQVRESQARSRKYEYGKGTSDSRQGQESQGMFSGGDFKKEPEQEYENGGGQTSGAGYRKASGTAASYRRYDQYERKGRQGYGASDRWANLLLFIILAVFTSPIWGAALSAVLGAIGVAIAAVVLLGICAVGGVVAGVVCTVVAIVRLCTLSLARGLFILGIGMLLIAGSGISIILLLLLCGRFLPWAIGQTSRLFHRILHWGRSTA